MGLKYRCVATSVAGFVQQLAVAYITHGYWFYVAGTIPEGKDATAVDAKLVEQYGIAITKWARCRRKKQGLANMQYLRHEQFFVLLATMGQHVFFERERESFRDVRRVPIKFAGYSIGCRKSTDGRWHVSVRLAAENYAEIRAFALENASLPCTKRLTTILNGLASERFAPIQRQAQNLIRQLNRRRRIAGLSQLNCDPLETRRKIIAPFG